LIPVFSQSAGNFNILHEHEKMVMIDDPIRQKPIMFLQLSEQLESFSFGTKTYLMIISRIHK